MQAALYSQARWTRIRLWCFEIKNCNNFIFIGFIYFLNRLFDRLFACLSVSLFIRRMVHAGILQDKGFITCLVHKLGGNIRASPGIVSNNIHL